VRAPLLVPQLKAAKGLEQEQIQASLALLARALDEYAADILHGDFAIFATLEERIKQHFREHPQEITVWVAEDSSEERAAQLADKVRQSAPMQPVVVRKYQRPSNRRKRAGGRLDSSR
jgi:hypothetical protein